MKTEQTISSRQRKFFFWMPLITLPFLFFAFWALGGGKQNFDNSLSDSSGLNYHLPEAQVVSGLKDKLETYQESKKKANKKEKQILEDPNLRKEDLNESVEKLKEDRNKDLTENADKIWEDKLDELRSLISEPESEPILQSPAPAQAIKKGGSPEIKQLEAMMGQVYQSSMNDPEMDRIEGLVDKLIILQNPNLPIETVEELMGSRDFYEVEPQAVQSLNLSSGIEEREIRKSIGINKFYSLQNAGLDEENVINPSISASIANDQVVSPGEAVQLKLDEPVKIKGLKLNQGATLSGICFLKGNRLEIQVTAIRKGQMIIPVQLFAVGLDAVRGLKVPVSAKEEGFQDFSNRGLQGIGGMGFSNSWEDQAARVGMETMKGFFSKKVKAPRIKLKAGHPFLLVSEPN